MLNRLCFSFHLLAKTALQVKSGQNPVPEPSKTPVFPCFNYSLNRCFTNSCFAVVKNPYQIVQIGPFQPDYRRLSVRGCRCLDHPFPFSILRRHPFSPVPVPDLSSVRSVPDTIRSVRPHGSGSARSRSAHLHSSRPRFRSFLPVPSICPAPALRAPLPFSFRISKAALPFSSPPVVRNPCPARSGIAKATCYVGDI